MRKLEKPGIVESPDYLRGYRDGQRDRIANSRIRSGDGILGALLAIALLLGIGYFGYNYATTGQLLPQVDVTRIVPHPGSEAK
ncbi:hypothetical protein K9N68_02385 [Kovacikia minuta CCNUW1]|uniref:hypothetical protein n=1 Tax=Kovacikia minuta TaxID=2931930 RepID=UPI001CCC550E|nr:hypothetical protein [Kovacikia minuta]UBF26857.1 hypothetical protein K9N68_02385 [Kovacikia minuta CCNUW1]